MRHIELEILQELAENKQKELKEAKEKVEILEKQEKEAWDSLWEKCREIHKEKQNGV